MPQPTSGSSHVNSVVSDLPPDLHALDYVRMLFRRKWLLFGSVFICAAVTLGISYVMPYTYSAESLILPPDRVSSAGLLNSLNASGALKMLKEIENPSVDLIQNLLESRVVLEEIGRDSALHRYFGRSLSGQALADKVFESLVLNPKYSQVRISSKLNTPWFSSAKEKESARVLSAHLVNCAVRVMDSAMIAVLNGEEMQHVAFAQADFAKKSAELDSLAVIQADFETKYGIVQLKTQTLATIEQLATLKANQMQSEIEESNFSTDLSQSSSRRSLSGRNVLAAKLESERFKVRSELGPSLSELPAVNRTYANILIEKSTLEPIVIFLEREVHQSEINAARARSLISIIDPAIPPEARSSPSRVAMLMLGLFSGLMIVILYLTVETSVKTWNQAERQ